jgi:hypothetical protein
MNLVTEISNNFWKWRYRVLDENITMYSHQFSDNTHHRLKDNFHSAFNYFVEGNKTTIVNCFNSYSSIVIFLEKAVESRNAIKPYSLEIINADNRE